MGKVVSFTVHNHKKKLTKEKVMSKLKDHRGDIRKKFSHAEKMLKDLEENVRKRISNASSYAPKASGKQSIQKKNNKVVPRTKETEEQSRERLRKNLFLNRFHSSQQ
jgi:hypothetical protein